MFPVIDLPLDILSTKNSSSDHLLTDYMRRKSDFILAFKYNFWLNSGKGSINLASH